MMVTYNVSQMIKINIIPTEVDIPVIDFKAFTVTNHWNGALYDIGFTASIWWSTLIFQKFNSAYYLKADAQGFPEHLLYYKDYFVLLT